MNTKLKKKLLLYTYVFIFCCNLFGLLSVSAASVKTQNAKAITVYKKVLLKKSISYTSNGGRYSLKPSQFALVDIDKNGIKEMIIREGIYSDYLIYAFDGNKAVRICTAYTWQSCAPSYSSKTKSVHFPLYSTVGTEMDCFVKIKSAYKLNQTVFTRTMDWNTNKSCYSINGKSVSYSTFSKKFGLFSGNGVDAQEIHFISNNNYNRVKMNAFKYIY